MNKCVNQKGREATACTTGAAMIVDTSKLDYAFILRRYDAEADTGDMPQAVADNMLPVIRAQKRHRDEWRSLSGGV